MISIRVPGGYARSGRWLALVLGSLGVWGIAAMAARPDEPVRKDQLPIASGPFEPTRSSLKTYQYPEWFRDAKLGMWAHWGPQAVPMFGDWYARQLYQQGHPSTRTTWSITVTPPSWDTRT